MTISDHIKYKAYMTAGTLLRSCGFLVVREKEM